MSSYAAPIQDMKFVLEELAGLGEVAKLPGYEEATPDLVEAVLSEAGKLASGVLAPLNAPGDIEGAKWGSDFTVTMPPGFKQAYRQFIDGGWNALAFEVEFGGQGLPRLISTAVQEMWKASNMAFSLCPLLTQGAIEALLLRGSDAQRHTYLHKMIAGEWTGTMNLTEPQAGSDLSLVRTRAVPEGDHYRIFGQKIFITYGEHDMVENIVHLVLARTPEAPAGVKGISLFVVPKFLVNADGSLGKRNDVRCVSIEHKLGIHASPTAVMSYGDDGGAIGTLIGDENRGLEYMFIMMNAARFAVGLEGVAISERAYQQAVAYARDRVQSRDAVHGSSGPVPIIKHPDVRRMLMSMRAQIEAMRALAYVTAAALDSASRHPDRAERERHQAFVDLLIPVVKGWSTETGIEVATTGIQIHGGMGFIEETGAAQHLRDARITTIYEGTTGIQANDLVGRKIAREGGQTAKAVLALIFATCNDLGDTKELAEIRSALQNSAQALADAVDFIVSNYKTDPGATLAGAVPFLKLMGIVCGGWQMARAALVAQNKLKTGEGDSAFYAAKIVTAKFFASHFLAQASGLRNVIVNGGSDVMALAEEAF
jgi:alkylation response protein AidB-like acyl-CoA dehydrogenase